MTQEQLLLSQLRGLRRKIRTLFALDGLGRLLALVPPAVLAAILLDYLIKFPALFRAAMLLCLLALAVALIVRRLWQPLRTPISVQDVAVELESHFAKLDDRLASTVNFIESPDGRAGESVELRQAVVAETLKTTTGMPFARALNPRPLVVMFLLGIVIAAGIVSLGAWQADAAMIGMTRLFNPLTDCQWPRRTLLDVGSERRFIIPIGEDFQARVSVEGVVPDRLYIRYREAGTDAFAPAEIMKPLDHVADGNVFVRTFTRVRKPFEFYITGGDDDTRRGGLVLVDARPRPRVENVVLQVTPPPYITDGEAVVFEGQGSARALQGSQVVMEILTNKPIADDGGRPKADVLFGRGEQQRTLPLTFVSDEPLPDGAAGDEETARRMAAERRLLRAEFEVDQTEFINFRMVCLDGFDSEPGETLTLVADRDEPPRVRIVEPTQAIMDVTFRSVVPIKAHIQDDCGVAKAALGWQRGTSEDKGAMGLTAVRPVEKGTDARPLALTAVRRWDLRDIEPELQVGDELVYRCVAVDNFQWRGQGPHTAESQEYRLRVVSVESMAEAMRRKLLALGLRVSDLVRRQEDLQAGTKDTRSEKQETEPLSQRGREQTMGQEDSQRQLKQQAEEIRDEFDDLLTQYRLNRIPQDEAFDHSVETQQALDDVAKDPMPKAAQALRQSRDGEATPQKQTETLDEAVNEQQRAIDRLRDALSRLERFTEAEAIAQKLRQILRQQEKLTERTGDLANQTLGKSQSELTAEERDTQQSLSSRQGELARELKEAVDQMKQSAQDLEQSNQAVSDALKETAKDAETRDPVRKMRNASRQIGQNQAAVAGTGQKSAEEDIKALIEKLENRREQELQNRISSLKELQKELGEVRKKEEGHLQENKDAQAGQPNAPKPEQQAPKQGQTAQQTGQLSQKMEQAGSPQAAEATQGAQQSMGQAQSQLSQSQSQPAQQNQEKSLEQLDQANRELEQDIQDAEQALAEEQLEAIKQQLARIKDGEVKVNESTVDLEAKRQAEKFARSDAERLIFTQDHQKELLTETGEIVKELQEANVTVFTFVLKIVGDRMDESHQRLRKEETDPITQSAQQKAIEYLDKLVRALEEEISNRRRRGGGGGGGGGGGQGQAQLVPTLAELKML
ncbi:MAG: hypothetical protein JXL80_16445, partial [Planctomycetes bacterium]|nr:hypothetical protein [Planctomycetota bacterium]